MNYEALGQYIIIEKQEKIGNKYSHTVKDTKIRHLKGVVTSIGKAVDLEKYDLKIGDVITAGEFVGIPQNDEATFYAIDSEDLVSKIKEN